MPAEIQATCMCGSPSPESFLTHSSFKSSSFSNSLSPENRCLSALYSLTCTPSSLRLDSSLTSTAPLLTVCLLVPLLVLRSKFLLGTCHFKGLLFSGDTQLGKHLAHADLFGFDLFHATGIFYLKYKNLGKCGESYQQKPQFSWKSTSGNTLLFTTILSGWFSKGKKITLDK